MFISTHARYLENDDMIQNTPDSKIVLEEISNNSPEKLVDTVDKQQQHVTLNTLEPRRNGGYLGHLIDTIESLSRHL